MDSPTRSSIAPVYQGTPTSFRPTSLNNLSSPIQPQESSLIEGAKGGVIAPFTTHPGDSDSETSCEGAAGTAGPTMLNMLDADEAIPIVPHGGCCDIDAGLNAVDKSHYFIPTYSKLPTLLSPAPSLHHMDAIDGGPLTPPSIQSKNTHHLPPIHIIISDAVIVNENSGSPFTSFRIETRLPSAVTSTSDYLSFQSFKRYSEFETFRKCLTGLFPHILIPPIPEKHSIGQYASKPGKAKLNPVIVDRRKISLQAFLNRLARHSVLSKSHVFHLFLRGEKSMAEIMINLGISKVWKRKDSSLGYSESTKLRHPDAQFSASMDYTLKFSYFMTMFTKWMKTNRYNLQDLSSSAAELGAIYNGWSLLDAKPSLAATIERTGEYFDHYSILLKRLGEQCECSAGLWAYEYSLYSKHIIALLAYRHRKNVEYEVLSESLILKNSALRALEASEEEAIRLTAALAAQGSFAPPTKQTGIMGTINNFLDKDPEVSRRNAISKTKAKIQALQEKLEAVLKTLKAANQTITVELNEFQAEKERNIRQMLIAFADGQRELHQSALTFFCSSVPMSDDTVV